MTKLASISALIAFSLVAQAQGVQMEQVAYGGWAHCVKLSNGSIELIATTDVGPRLIRLGFAGGQNLFKEYAEMLGKTGGGEWRIYGGHRLWHAPEEKPRTYWPDNAPVEQAWDGTTLKLVPPPETDCRIQKQMEVTMDPAKARVTVLHRLTNLNQWDVELAPWALTVMAPGGRAIYPQEPYIPHTEYLLPARPLVLWHYTNMADPRWVWGEKCFQLKQDASATTPQKVGFLNKQGWVAYSLNGELFVKQFEPTPGASYPDFGCNTETFTNADMLEVETLGPLTTLAANGGSVEHTEVWSLHKLEVGEDEAEIVAKVLPLVGR